jgi:hypothetical protein
MATLLRRQREISPEDIPEPQAIEAQVVNYGVPFAQKPVKLTQGELLVLLNSLGLTRDEIARVLGSQANYIDQVINKSPDLQEAIKEARKQADIQVVNALFRRAVGYNYCEVLYDNYGKIYRKAFKHLPPDVTACIFWLKNRMKDEWADTFKGELTLRDRMDLGARQLAGQTETK